MTAEVWTPQHLLDALAGRGDRPALVALGADQADVRTYRDIADQASRLAAGLVDRGVAAGEPVALFAPNGPEWVVARLAIAAAGAVGTAIDDVAGADEVAMILRDSGCRRLFVAETHLSLVRDVLAGLQAPHDGFDIILIGDGGGSESGGSETGGSETGESETGESETGGSETGGDPPGDMTPDDANPTTATSAETLVDWRRVFAPAPRALRDPDPQDHAALIYTSGTTGSPKSFFLTYANISANLEAIRTLGVVGPDDRLLLPLPLHHVYPFVVGLLTPLVIGAAVVFPEAATGPQIVRAVKEGGATVMIGVPRLYEAMLTGMKTRAAGRGRAAAALFNAMLRLSLWSCRTMGMRPGRVLFRPLHREIGPQLRLMVSAGAKLAPEITWDLVGLGWQVLTGYGLAETSSAFTGNVPGRLRIGSEGRPLHGGEVRIGDAGERGGESGVGARGVGEIQLRGPNVFAGYRNNPEANAGAFTADGWFRSGDQGYLDADGFVYVTGRIKELIVLGGGKKVFPEEMESLYGTTDVIKEIAVLERAGGLAGLVVPDLEAIRKRGNARIDDVIRVHLTSVGRDQPPHQRLTGFALTQQPLPRTRLGKYRRHELPELYEKARRGERGAASEAMTAEDRAVIERSPGREVSAILRERYPGKPLSLDANPQLDLGIDSLEWLNIGLDLEQRLGVRLSEDDIAGAESVRALIEIVDRNRAGGGEVATGEGAAGLDAPLSEDEGRWLEPPSGALVALQWFLYWLNRGLARAMFRLRATGLEHLPTKGPFVVVANHVSDIDPMIVAAALPLDRMRRVHWGGDKDRLFGGALSRRFCRAAQIFPVDERRPSRALAMAAAVLERGETLVWFPEMWRSPTGHLQRFLPGIGKVLSRVPVPVVPAYIDGAFEAMPRDRRLPRPHPVTITFGPVVEMERLKQGGEGDNESARIANALHDRVAALAPPATGS